MSGQTPLYRYWSEYPDRDSEYVRWYPPTLRRIEPERILGHIDEGGPKSMAFYVHVPLCKDICPYCPFNKFSMRQDRAASFLDAVCREIDIVAQHSRNGRVTFASGYFGGGTPTALETADIRRLVSHCFDRLDVASTAEVSIEANPDTVDEPKLAALRAEGVNRISFGVQSFQAPFLDLLGRTHSAGQAIKAIQMAQRVGFDNIAIDLMYRLPGQSVSHWHKDLSIAVSLGIQHISTYSLFLDPGTKMYNETLVGRISQYPNEQDEMTMYQLSQQLLGESGFHQYTINDFAQPARESEHHCTNWRAPQGSYVGMGPGAFGFVGDPSSSYIYCTIHALRDYVESVREGRLPVRLGKRLSRAEEMSRYLVLGLRCLEVRKAVFLKAFGLPVDDVFGTQIAQLADWGLIEHDSDRLWMTQQGKHYASNVLKAFFGPENHGKPQPIGVELMAGRGLSMSSVTFDNDAK